MAWKLQDKLREGQLDNTTPGKVKGWLQFAGMKDTVILRLDGDFSSDIRGGKIYLHNPDPAEETRRSDRMEGFARLQVGKVVNITAGRHGASEAPAACIEWHSDQNGLVLLTLPPQFVKIELGAASSTKRDH